LYLRAARQSIVVREFIISRPFVARCCLPLLLLLLLLLLCGEDEEEYIKKITKRFQGWISLEKNTMGI
jgi:hypothetical protein